MPDKSIELETYNPRLTGPLRQTGQAGILSGRRDGVAGVWPTTSFRVENKNYQFGALGNAAPQALPSMSSFSLSLRADMRPFRRHRFEAAEERHVSVIK